MFFSPLLTHYVESDAFRRSDGKGDCERFAFSSVPLLRRSDAPAHSLRKPRVLKREME